MQFVLPETVLTDCGTFDSYLHPSGMGSTRYFSHVTFYNTFRGVYVHFHRLITCRLSARVINVVVSMRVTLKWKIAKKPSFKLRKPSSVRLCQFSWTKHANLYFSHRHVYSMRTIEIRNDVSLHLPKIVHNGDKRYVPKVFRNATQYQPTMRSIVYVDLSV